MAPNISDCLLAQEMKPCEKQTENNSTTNAKLGTAVLEPDPNNNLEYVKQPQTNQKQQTEQSLVWRNIVIIAYAHIAGLIGMYNMYTGSSWPSLIFAHVLGFAGAFGITAGAHRLFAHKSYKAKIQLRVLLMLFQTFAFQNSIYEWARDHRAHHKYTDTDADPHNSKRGFFYSHVGWLMMRKHSAVKEKVSNIYMDDLKEDPVVMWQKRNYGWFMPVASFLGPALISYFVFGETALNAWNIHLGRWVISVNITWLLNSAAHIWGWRPYDKNHSSTDTALLGFLCFGEGWHNYHHVFPWDYKTSELTHYHFNFTNGFIDFFAKIGWAYDLKTVGKDMIKHRVLRTGDGSHPVSKIQKQKEEDDMKAKLVEYVNRYHADNLNLVWGWDDKDMPTEDKEYVTIYNKTE